MLLLLLAIVTTAGAQQFGKNKVQYRTFDWKYIQSDHFDIYFYDEAGVNLAKFAAHVCENALQDIEEHWRYRINNRIPVIIYNSHNDFQQTNVVSEYLPEGVGGVTELFKNRVNVPFEGDWEKYRHVLHHELVHAVINDKFYGGTLQSLITNNVRFFMPIWMNEGLAEYESLNGYDIETDMFIRDAVIGGYLPELQNLNGYMAYRGGQAFYWYVEQNYGREKIGELLNRAKASGSLDEAFRGAFGKSVEEFSEQWQYDLKKIYWPDVADRKRPIDFAERLTNHRVDESFFNTSPSISPNGDKLAWISDRDRFRSVFVMDINHPGSITKLVEGEENDDFEELHLLTPAIAWSPDSRQVSLAVKSKGFDVIYVIDVESGDQRRLEFDMDAIYSVNWSPDGKQLAFQGIKGDQSDIYVYDIATETTRNLTRDIFSDFDPHWGPDNRTIYFLSDRRDHPVGEATREEFLIWNYDYDARDIYSIDSETRSLSRLTHSDRVRESSPTPGPDGRLLYISDRNGINNVYAVDLKTGESRPLTNSISGIEQLSLSKDASKVVFTSWNGDGQDVFLLRMPFVRRLDSSALAETKFLQMRVTEKAVLSDTTASDNRMTVVTPLKGYGGVRIDPSEAMPPTQGGESVASVASSKAASVAPPDDARTVAGDYNVKDYKVKFTPDFIMATGNYSSFYGVQGVTQMLFSDMLGNHQIFIATNLLLDLKNSDFIVSYYYLPEMIDYGIQLFQSSRLLNVQDGEAAVPSRFRQYGVSALASKPFDRFSRLDFGLTGMVVTREPLLQGSTLSEQSKPLLSPSMSYVFDNTVMWAFNPISGSRYNLTAQASPKLGTSGVGFYTFLGDVRHYIPIGRGEYSIGARISGGASFGPDPQKFMLGGIQNWINWEYDNGYEPIKDAEDITFLQPGLPLRGFSYGDQIGSKYFLGNLEFRFPLFRALVSGPLPVLFQYVSGVMFLDVGSAWNDSFSATRTNEFGATVTDDLRIGTGIGARAYVLGIPLRLDVAWNYNLDSWSKPRYYLSLGYDF